MEDWDFLIYQCFLTVASLPPTENKRCSDFFLVYYFFQDWNRSKLNILNLDDNQHFATSEQGLNCLQTK